MASTICCCQFFKVTLTDFCCFSNVGGQLEYGLYNFRATTHYPACDETTLCLKKFPPLNFLQLCQILTDFQNICTAGKLMKFATIRHYPPHLWHVATIHWEIKNSNFVQMWKKMQTNCIFNFLYLCYSLIKDVKVGTFLDTLYIDT